MRQVVLAGVSGVLFALGLCLGGMTQPSKVIGFLDVTGNWDPSLLFVMGGALLVFGPLYQLRVHGRMVFSETKWVPPPFGKIDARLLLGAALFGVGWGLVGYCPGPAIVALGAGARHSLWFVTSMIVGMALFRASDRWLRVPGDSVRRASGGSAAAGTPPPAGPHP